VDIVSIIIQLIAGAAGGNIVGSLAKNLSLGTAGNTIAGAIGGFGGAQILDMLLGGSTTAVADATAAVANSGLDIGTIIQNIAGGGVGGGILMLIAGLIKSMTAK
jgi:hypothetical protein